MFLCPIEKRKRKNPIKKRKNIIVSSTSIVTDKEKQVNAYMKNHGISPYCVGNSIQELLESI